MGTSSPPFKAIFKSNGHRQFITDLFHKTSFRSHSPEPWKPQFVCIRTQAEAQAWGSGTPDLWQKCTSGRVASLSLLPSKTLFLCPHFFALPSDTRVPKRETCPVARDNKFADNSHRIQFKASQIAIITQFALRLYNSLRPLPPPSGKYVPALNAIVGWNADEAIQNTGSFKLFINCRICSDQTYNVL